MDESETYNEPNPNMGLLDSGNNNMKSNENVNIGVNNTNSNNLGRGLNNTNFVKKYNFNYNNLSISNKKFLSNKNHLYIKAGIKQGINNSKKFMNKGSVDNRRDSKQDRNTNMNNNGISNNDKFSDQVNNNYNIENATNENNIYNEQTNEYNYANMGYNPDSEGWEDNENVSDKNVIPFNARIGTNNSINNGNNNMVQRKRRTNKFETGNQNFKNKQKKFYNTTVNDSLKRYNNNPANVDGINNNEENEEGQDFSNVINTNVENNKMSNELNKRQLNNNRNLKHINNFGNKKMFNNMTFSINKYLNTNVNFQKHNNDKINNTYGKAKNKMTYKNLKIKNKENLNMPNDIRTHNSTSNTSNDYVNNLTREINGDQGIEGISSSSNYDDLNLLAQAFNYENVKILKSHLEGNTTNKKRNNTGSNIEGNKDDSKFLSYIEWLSEVSEITDEENDIEDMNNNNRKNNNAKCSQINSQYSQNDQTIPEQMKGLYSQFAKYNYKNEQTGEFGQNAIDNNLPYFENNKNQGILGSDNLSGSHLARYSSEKKNDSFIDGQAEFDAYGKEEINSINLIETQNGSNLNNAVSSNYTQENETNKINEPINDIPIEDLFITSYMPYPPEKYNNIYDLHEIKIMSPHILKTTLHKKGKTYHSSLKDGKLILMLDLDNTLLQATSFAKFNMELPLENFIGENDEPELYKFFLPYYNFFYYLKFRPYVRQFLEILSLYYELSIYTNATREYADVVIAILDPDRTIFADRIVARCSSVDRDENKHFEKIYPNVDPKYVIAFDDRKDVWYDIPHSHILRAEHYNFFELSKYDIISHFKEPNTCKKRFVDMDMHLHYMIKIFLKIHKQFFENPLNVDVGKIIDNIMLSTLSDVGLYFTGFRKNSKNLQNVLSSDCEERQKEIALELGAKIYSNYDDPGVTHIIAAKNCTDNLIKSKQSNYSHIEKVHTLWLYHCRGTLENDRSSLFDADDLCKIYNNKPPLHPKKDHWFFGNKDVEKKQENKSDCIKIENLKSRIFLGTGEYTNDAVICSPYEQISIKWIEKEVKLRQIYDNPPNFMTQDKTLDLRSAEKRNNDETTKNVRDSNFIGPPDLDISDKVIQQDKQ
ncbi:NLI interacting factor-like phosphatase, putative [Plasmodium vinckei]|uniref:protein-serine/threonine phosphatase n=1 Tax=Plasmodium vinckei TaxID=5860 RepID=A0A6V7T785_PLAVN|nr:NLI interacting factor-like phosphatase, putative [Plasmodium vinckei]